MAASLRQPASASASASSGCEPRGCEQWRVRLADDLEAFAVASRGIAVVDGTTFGLLTLGPSDRLELIDPGTGAVRWDLDLEAPRWARVEGPWVVANRGRADETLLLDGATGEVLQIYEDLVPLGASTAVAGSRSGRGSGPTLPTEPSGRWSSSPGTMPAPQRFRAPRTPRWCRPTHRSSSDRAS